MSHKRAWVVRNPLNTKFIGFLDFVLPWEIKCFYIIMRSICLPFGQAFVNSLLLFRMITIIFIQTDLS